MVTLVTLLAPLRTADTVHQLWEEYEAQQTLEALLVKELDVLDMVIQASTYEQRYCRSESPDYNRDVQDLSSFFDSTHGRIYRFPALKALDDQIRDKRHRATSRPL